MGMESLDFKGFPAHAHGVKGVSTSDAGDGRHYDLRLCTEASTSDTGDADGRRLMHEDMPTSDADDG